MDTAPSVATALHEGLLRDPGAHAAGAAPRGCTSLKLRQLSRRVSQHFDRHLAQAGLKTTQYSLLSHVVKLAPVCPGALARALEMDASTLTRNLQPLVAQGWVSIGPGEDARSRCVVATAAGRAKRNEAQRAWKRAQLALNARWGNDCVLHLHRMIDDCLDRMGPRDAAHD